MPRVKRGTVRRAKRKKLLARTKGMFGNKSKLYRAAKESGDTALKYAFVGRRNKKRDFRRLWVIRINAGAREHGLSYSQFITGLKVVRVMADLVTIHPIRKRPKVEVETYAGKVLRPEDMEAHIRRIADHIAKIQNLGADSREATLYELRARKSGN